MHGEPDLAIRVVRDVFNEDFKYLQVQGDDAWATVSGYVEGVAPELVERLSHHTGDNDLFHELRIDEQLMKALDRKVWLPSGGSLVIDRTEAMTVIDVNTGKFVGSGGNLEETVTRNNLEAAEEIVRQLRLRDVGGIVVIDFIDMVLESNRDLVLRRLTECLGRDRTKHQVAEVTSLGLVQMTRKRVGEGLLEAFSEPCEVCGGRGVIVHSEPIDRPGSADDDERPRGKQGKRRRGKGSGESDPAGPAASQEQRQAASAAMAAIHRATHGIESDADEPDVAPDSELVEVTLAEEAPEITPQVPAVAEPAAAEAGAAETAAAEPATTQPAALEPTALEPTAIEPAAIEAVGTEAAAEPDEVIESVAVTEAPGAPAPAAGRQPEPSAEPESGAKPERGADPEARPEPEAETSPAPRRRRRVASRPAGPPDAS
jgi:ribonuclease E